MNNKNMKQKIECKITGRVQMVMFRDFTQRKAKKLGIFGYVKNEDDGSVYVLAEGEKDNLEKFISLLKEGPILAKVDKVDVKWMPCQNEFSDFKIKYE